MILCILTCKHNRLTYYYKQITLTINKTFISLGFLFLQDINYRSLFLFLNNLSSSFFSSFFEFKITASALCIQWLVEYCSTNEFGRKEKEIIQPLWNIWLMFAQKHDLAYVRSIVTASCTHYMQTYRISKRKNESMRSFDYIVSGWPWPTGDLWKRRTREKKKNSYCTIGQYTIVFKVIELVRINYLHLHMLF